MSRLLDPSFKYVGSAATSVMETWKRHGFKPTTKLERNARKKPVRRASVLPFRRVITGR